MFLTIHLNLDNAILAFIYMMSAFVLFFVGKMVYQLFHKDIRMNEELVEKDNFAFATANVGYYIGLLLAIGSALIGESSGDVIYDLIGIAQYGLLAIVLLNATIIFNDKFILYKFKVKKEIVEDQNVGTGVVEGASAVASGLIILGALSGEDRSILMALCFWGIGQFILVLATFLYNAITPYDLHDEIEKDNVAVGLAFAGLIVAMGNIIGFGVDFDFYSWEDSGIDLFVDTAIGLIMIPIARFLTDKILLPGQRLTDELVNQEKPNNGAGLMEAFAYIGGSVLISWCL